jgi:hypothetical protein
MQRQFEWQMREIREEQAHEKRQLLKRAEIDREDLESRCQRASREVELLRQALAERDTCIEELASQVEAERAAAQEAGERLRAAWELTA